MIPVRWTGIGLGEARLPPVAIKRWLTHDYPAIVKRAKQEKAELHWVDETGVSNQANHGRGFAPEGETPVIRRPAKRFTQSMISSVTNRGKPRFMIYDGALDTAIFLMFPRRLIRDTYRTLFVVVDKRHSPSAPPASIC